jgi:hypothetical protein
MTRNDFRVLLLISLFVMSTRITTMAAESPVQCDLLVYGSTPGAVACAVRAAREGLDVTLVTHAKHLGGLLTSGLSTMDTLYNGPRAPLYDELRAAIHAHYRDTDGADSENYKRSLPGEAKTKFEARVVEHLINDMLAHEPRIRVVKGFYPVEAVIQQRMIRQVTFQAMLSNERFRVVPSAVADCSYEADLAAVAGVPYRVGRESSDTFQEKHAGRIFMRSVSWPPANVDPGYLAEYRRFNLVHYNSWYEIVEAPGTADSAVQAYNLRTLLTDDPDNRLPVTQPAGYNREALVHDLETRVNWDDRIPGTKVPNRKTYWNLPELLGVQTDYVEGDWAKRQQVRESHAQLTLSLLYFLQTDQSIPEEVRNNWKKWGLPKDEFPDSDHLPYEIYMRETRRIIGREVFTEHDALPVSGMKRAPVHPDSISITEWFLDSHACTPEKIPGSIWEGELLLKNITVPGQVSWQTLLPVDLDNLLVPVCVSSSHIGWGAIRLEPTWMALGEAAAWGIVLAARDKVAPASVKTDSLLRQLAERRIMLSFFNDVEHDTHTNWYAAIQYLGTQGYFGFYDALPEMRLHLPLAKAWVNHTAARQRGETPNATAAACNHWKVEAEGGEPISASNFARLLDSACDTNHFTEQLPILAIEPTTPVTRANACRLIYSATVQGE